MKILSIITSVNPEMGGPIQGIRNYQSTLVNLGCSRDVVTFEDSNDVLSWDFSESLIIYSLGKAKTQLAYNNNLLSFLKKNITNYDVVIIEGLWLYNSYCTVQVFKWFKKNRPGLKIPKLYIMPHGMLDPWFQNKKTRLWKSIRNSIYWHLVEKKVVNYVDGLLFTCEVEMLLARTTFQGYNPKKEINVGFGINHPPENSSTILNAFLDLCPEIKGEKYILFLSRIHFKKGVDLLINSYNYLSTKKLNLPHLVIAGSNDSSYAKEMISLSSNNPKIHFPGMLIGDVKWGAFYGCEAFILPSHQENFGIAVAEALACGKPVLISNKINIYKEIEEGSAGIISEDTLEGTISNLDKWLNLSLVEKQEMSDSAYLVYFKHFTIEKSAQTFLSHIK